MNALINVKKNKGWTSQDVCSKIKNMLKVKKVGHAGTLDPNATGVLPICIGSATKICLMITDWYKIYECNMILGLISDSFDTTTNITKIASAKKINNLNINNIKKIINKFIGKYDQYPPIYSARKINGKKLYEYARLGCNVEIKSKKIEIYSINIISINLPFIKIIIKCSKGTYIRSLCNDIGKELGVGAVMDDLKRIQVGPFKYKNSYTISEIQNYVNNNNIHEILIPIENIFNTYTKAIIQDDFVKYAYNGNSILPQYLIFNQLHELPHKICIYDSKRNFIGIYYFKDNKYIVYKLFYQK